MSDAPTKHLFEDAPARQGTQSSWSSMFQGQLLNDYLRLRGQYILPNYLTKRP